MKNLVELMTKHSHVLLISHFVTWINNIVLSCACTVWCVWGKLREGEAAVESIYRVHLCSHCEMRSKVEFTTIYYACSRDEMNSDLYIFLCKSKLLSTY